MRSVCWPHELSQVLVLALQIFMPNSGRCEGEFEGKPEGCSEGEPQEEFEGEPGGALETEGGAAPKGKPRGKLQC
jgi:hypothetical protein